ncbi:MAG TPA: hypothetical protein VFQ45_06465 [Longimicrobium sp.]|nr:hypothetical protein [Longimicrobium sp.]
MTLSRTLRLLLALCLAPAAGTAQAAGEVVRGRVVPADGAVPAGLVAVLRVGARADTAAVDSAGAFVLPRPLGLADSVELVVDAGDVEARAYHPALVRVPAREMAGEVEIVLVPRAWTIRGGRHAGTTVPVSVVKARTAVCAGCSSFYQRAQDPLRRDRYQGWRLSAFPLRMAFDREDARPAGAAPDSVAFWRIVEAMEDGFGGDLFRPAAVAETLPDDENGPNDVVLVIMDSRLPIAALTNVLSRRGDVNYAAVRFQRRMQLSGDDGPRLVTHELMHALGMGHTCEWTSSLADLSRCPGLRSEQVTAADVAYTQLLYRVREVQEATGARWAFDAALAGERRFILGLY